VFKSFSPKERSILGIDINSASVNIVQLSCRGPHYCLERYGQSALPNNSIEGGVIKYPEAVASCISNLLSTLSSSCKQAILAVPDSSVISKTVQIPAGLSDYYIEELVFLEAEKYVSSVVTDLYIDFKVLGPSVKSMNMTDVLMIASRAEIVDCRIELMKRVNLDLTVLDVESYALERATQGLSLERLIIEKNEHIVILNIGPNDTQILVLRGMKIIFSHEDYPGDIQLLQTLMQRYGMTLEEANAALERSDFPSDYDVAVLQPFISLILQQVTKALQFFFSSNHHVHVDCIVLAGSVVRQPGFRAFFQQQISIPTHLANPFSQMRFSANIEHQKMMRDSPMMMLACGLALRLAE